ncbi:hypothetical protein ACW9JY_06670 [Petrotoga sp. DB-2]
MKRQSLLLILKGKERSEDIFPHPYGWSYEMKGQNIVFFLMGGERGKGALKHAKDRRNGKKGGNPKC